MEPRANYALIGAFVILAAVALMGFALWMGQNQFRQAFDEYDVIFEGPVTLDEGAAVRYIGINVGEVRWVRIDRADPSKVRARLRVDAETPVKEDSTATIDFAGITGVTFVQINAGSANAPRLTREPGQPVPVIEADRTQLSELINSGRTILSQASETADQVNALLTNENIARVSATLGHLEVISARLAAEDGLIANANATLQSVERAADQFARTGASLEAVGEEADRRIAELGETVETLAAQATTTLSGIDAATQESERAAASIADIAENSGEAAVTDLRLAAQDLRRLIARLDALARELETNPQSLVRGEARPYEE